MNHRPNTHANHQHARRQQWLRALLALCLAVAAPLPTRAATYQTNTTPLTTLAGEARDDRGVIRVTWQCPQCTPTGGEATCARCGPAGTSVGWYVGEGIGLRIGENEITVTAYDAEEQTGTATLTVVYAVALPTDMTPPVVLLTTPAPEATVPRKGTVIIEAIASDNIGVEGTVNLHIDHKVAVANGGTNDLDNLQLLCETCNGHKSDRD